MKLIRIKKSNFRKTFNWGGINEKNLTVFMPVYNREKYLKESIESVLKQNFQIFVD